MIAYPITEYRPIPQIIWYQIRCFRCGQWRTALAKAVLCTHLIREGWRTDGTCPECARKTDADQAAMGVAP